MRFVKALYFNSPSTPKGLALLVGQDEAGCLHVKSWIDPEAPPMRFVSVKELEEAAGEKLTLVREVEIKNE